MRWFTPATERPELGDVLVQTPSCVRALREKVHDASVGFRDAWRLMSKLPRATFVVLDQAEHGLLVDQQDLFAALVRDWLGRVEEAQAGRP